MRFSLIITFNVSTRYLSNVLTQTVSRHVKISTLFLTRQKALESLDLRAFAG